MQDSIKEKMKNNYEYKRERNVRKQEKLRYNYEIQVTL